MSRCVERVTPPPARDAQMFPRRSDTSWTVTFHPREISHRETKSTIRPSLPEDDSIASSSAASATTSTMATIVAIRRTALQAAAMTRLVVRRSLLIHLSAAEGMSVDHARPIYVAILGTDALLAARPVDAVQLSRACQSAGFDLVVPVSWGEEVIANYIGERLASHRPSTVVVSACPLVPP